jgi:hypothetical protein
MAMQIETIGRIIYSIDMQQVLAGEMGILPG